MLKATFVQAAGALELALSAQGAGKVTKRCCSLGMIAAKASLVQGQGAFDQGLGLPIVAALPEMASGRIEQPCRRLGVNAEGFCVAGCGQGVRQQPRTRRPGGRVGRLDRKGRTDKGQRGSCPLAFLVLVELLAGDRLNEAVKAQRLAVPASREQRVPPQRTDGLLVGERGPHGYAEPLGQHFWVLWGQAAGDVVWGQEGAQRQQILGCRHLLAQPLNRNRPGGGDGLFGGGRVTEREQLLGVGAKQGEVVNGRGGGLLQVGGGLLQRQRQVPQRRREPVQGRVVTAEPVLEERDRLGAGRHINRHGGGQTGPAGIAGGD
jgi:hypothetical protein